MYGYRVSKVMCNIYYFTLNDSIILCLLASDKPEAYNFQQRRTTNWYTDMIIIHQANTEINKTIENSKFDISVCISIELP